ncbi:MAG: DUF2914 domain-containing protein [Bdellovibrionales bacterium]|nr:DUF2914 domain-containing protein [Bdellovibrionales bacterium]
MAWRFVKDGVDSVFKLFLKSRGLSHFSRYLETHPYVRQHVLPYLCLVGGFLFDILTLGRIDQTWSLFQQGIFLFMIFLLLYLHERQERVQKWGEGFAKFWLYHEGLLQFFMGGLLSAYTLFYFKSSSSWMVLTFVLVLLLLMVLNEKKGLLDARFPIRYAMVSLCVCSFLIYLVPIVLRALSFWTFLLSIFLSILVYFVWMKLLIPRAQWKTFASIKKIIAGIVVPIVFLVLYSFKLVPPVPLAALTMGVYHDVQKKDDTYMLYYNRPWYLFWQKGDQTFYTKEGDKVWFFTSVFAPTDLKHEIYVKWQKREQNGWQTSDRIPIEIRGGRDEGYRGVAYKKNYSNGIWRILLETEDERELGRLSFEILPEYRDLETITNRMQRY